MALPVVLVDNDPGFRRSMRMVLELERDLLVVGEFGDGEDLLAAATTAAAGWRLVFLDIDMPRLDGVESVRRLKAIAPEVLVVMLTVFDDPRSVVEAICAGADGYLAKREAATDVVEQARVVLAGGSPLTPAVARHVLGALRATSAPRRGPSIELSRREREVLTLLVDGCAYKQVADRLTLSIDTVRTYIRTLYRKLQVHSVAEAVSRALREGLV